MNGHSIPLKYINQLEKLISAKKTGVLTMSINNKAVLLSLENGEVGYIFFRSRKGIAALSLLTEELAQANLEKVELSFDATPVLSTDNVLPLTESFLNALKGIKQTATQSDILTDAGALAPIPGVLLTEPIKAIITETLVDLIGLVGKEICKHAFKSTQTLRVTIDVIAAELVETGLAATFKNRVRDRLAPLQNTGYSYCINEISKAEISASTRAGVVLTEETRAMLEELLDQFLESTEVDACRSVLQKTDSLRAAVDHIITQIANPITIQNFKKAVREKSQILDQHTAVV